MIFEQIGHNQQEIFSQIHHTFLQQIFKNSCKRKSQATSMPIQ